MHSEPSNEVNSFEKFIYNQHLRASRTIQNKPWRPREDFSKFTEEQALDCKKIARRLENNNINIEDFFYAPYFEDKKARVPLSFYASPKAISQYTQYMRYLDSLGPDDKKTLEKVVESLKYIQSYCLDKKYTTLKQYFEEDNGNSGVPTALIHLKQREVWDYCLLGFNEFDKALTAIQDTARVKFMLGENFYDNFDLKRTKFLNSKTCKALVREGKNKIENKITK